jgi:hypothetical protein
VIGGMVMKLIKESTTNKYEYQDEKVVSILVEEIEQYYYNDETEKEKHAKRMIDRGFSDSGQVKENIGTITHPNLVWFGSYYRYNRRTE